MGAVCELATSIPGNTSARPNSVATVAEMLKLNGYNTAAFGKMHQTPVWEISTSGPFDRWPTGDGFEKFWGFMGGETNQWEPTLFEGTTPTEPRATPEEGHHLTEEQVDQAIAWMKGQKAMTPDKPFFMYMSYGATHAPHHAPQEWIDKYRGRFDRGWDVVREETLAAQIDKGLVPADTELTDRPPGVEAWDDLTDEQRKVGARLMEAYAGFASHTDHHTGRLIDALEEIDILDDTIVIYIAGDNGASAEGGLDGAFNEIKALNAVKETVDDIVDRMDEIGSPTAFNHYPVGWAHAMNAPYQWTKQVASHFGGTRNGMVIHWPNGIEARGEVRQQFHHVIDIAPTLLEAAGLPQPYSVNGIAQKPIEGVAMNYAFDDAEADDLHTTQYFEMFGNRGLYHRGWTAVTKHRTPWELAAASWSRREVASPVGCCTSTRPCHTDSPSTRPWTSARTRRRPSPTPTPAAEPTPSPAPSTGSRSTCWVRTSATWKTRSRPTTGSWLANSELAAHQPATCGHSASQATLRGDGSVAGPKGLWEHEGARSKCPGLVTARSVSRRRPGVEGGRRCRLAVR